MKTLTLSITLLANSLALASTFKVTDPRTTSERIPVPIGNITCKKDPFRTSHLQVKLPKQVGSVEQKGILETNLMGIFSDDECHAIIMNLLKLAHDDKVDLETTVEARSVVKLVEYGSYDCEGAQQEVISLNIGGTTARESIFVTEGKLSCPDGIYPYHVRSRDNVIYVLHEDGIPTKSEY